LEGGDLMEAIRLNKRKKHIKILWKRILLVVVLILLIAAILTFHSRYRLAYRYILINGKERNILGISDSMYLKDDAIMEKAKELKELGYEIAYFNNRNKIVVHLTFAKRNNQGETDKIKEIYKENLDFYVYVHKITIEKKDYLVPANRGYEIIKQFKQKNPNVKDIFLQGSYAENKDIMSSEEIDKLINHYKK
jgi:hypothetical protein